MTTEFQGVLIIQNGGMKLESAAKFNEPLKVRAKDLVKEFQDEASKLVADKNKGYRIPVLFQLPSGAPKEIRKQDKIPADAPSANVPSNTSSNRPQGGQQRGRLNTGGLNREFHNSYNFVPIFPRMGLQNDLGDRLPAGHHKYLDDYYSGRLTVRLKTQTAILLPETGRGYSVAGNEGKRHPVFPIRLGPDGKPWMETTTIKGTLRPAYESITNSRLSVLDKHDRQLGYRMDANDAVRMVPVQIVDVGGALHAQLMNGTSPIGSDGRPEQRSDPMYAAWLPRWQKEVPRNPPQSGTIAPFASRYVSTRHLPQHRDEVEAWVEKVQKVTRDGRPIFAYWRIVAIEKIGNPLPPEPSHSDDRGAHRVVRGSMKRITGVVCVTSRSTGAPSDLHNIDQHHDERVFFLHPQLTTKPLPLSQEHLKAWTLVMDDYHELHADQIRNGVVKSPESRHSMWSQHVFDRSSRILKVGDLCYAFVRKSGPKFEIEALCPVIISRMVRDASPIDLIPDSLRPAKSAEDLSPADRVFGWVSGSKVSARNEQPYSTVTAWKGNLRITPAKFIPEASESDDPVERHGEYAAAFPLAILGQPKPSQARFYAGTATSDPLPDGCDKSRGYNQGDQIRGRKVYPHHQNWRDTTAGRNEHRQMPGAEAERTDQNRSVEAWLKEGQVFEFDIHVQNLSAIELGALLWLLQLPNEHFLRLGGGKALGFGSVRMELKSADLRDGQAIAADVVQLWGTSTEGTRACGDAESQPVKDLTQQLQKDFTDAVVANWNSQTGPKVTDAGRGNVILESFLVACRGFDDGKPVLTPRASRTRESEGKNFQWFTENERVVRDEPVRKASLQALWTPDQIDQGLPFYPPAPRRY